MRNHNPTASAVQEKVLLLGIYDNKIHTGGAAHVQSISLGTLFQRLELVQQEGQKFGDRGMDWQGIAQ